MSDIWQNQPSNKKLFGGLVGELVEAVVHTISVEGGEWPAVLLHEVGFNPLAPDPRESLFLSHMGRFWFATLDELQRQLPVLQAPTYFQPYSSCFTAIDALCIVEEPELPGLKPVPVLRLLQIT
jgi:hypothetical protein